MVQPKGNVVVTYRNGLHRITKRVSRRPEGMERALIHCTQGSGGTIVHLFTAKAIGWPLGTSKKRALRATRTLGYIRI